MTDEMKSLLETGAEVYPDGLRAMARFRSEIYLGARRSMIRNLKALAAATRLHLNQDDIRPCASPDGLAEEIVWDHLLTWVGAELTVPDRTHIYAVLWWNHHPSSHLARLAVSVSFVPWIVPWRRKITAIAQQIEGDGVFDEGGEVWLQEEVSPSNIVDFEDLFDRIFARWKPIFETLGGFPTQRSR